ncbi:hypothetical protein [Methylobacterium sp. AMS5]|uniref:hypothetical protein n=1 Tax=Methylobacterium sp. AMS5 TaxID=925818 RepID=UPI00074F8439|nr:hypothetical protein [Methylobacterium sp. AMS5]AMB48289.1 hypothetical protein Y590_25310 [Methylobacterium sp. AMS5]
MSTTLPRYIALCGNPKAGKTLVQTILQQDYGVQPIDDGLPLREIAVQQFGLTWDQVSTQAGKTEFVDVNGQPWQIRKILGEIGNALEDKFGRNILPALAIPRAEREHPDAKAFSFGSVRRDQGLVYRDRLGMVIGVRNPLAPPTGNEFDTFDETIVDFWIENDGVSIDNLKREVAAALKHWDALMHCAQTIARRAA